MQIRLLIRVCGVGALVFAAVSALLAGVSAFASWLPGRAAAAVDPNVALRRE